MSESWPGGAFPRAVHGPAKGFLSMLPGVDAIRAGYTTDAKTSSEALGTACFQGCPAALPFLENL